MTALLELRQLSVAYGKLHAVQAVDIHVNADERVCLIGANGAGKTTLLKTIAGMLAPVGGSVRMNGQPISHLPSHQRVGLGIALVPEGRGIFNQLSVHENLLMGAWLRRDTTAIRQEIDVIYQQLPRLGERRHQAAGNLSGGEQQLLSIHRALLGHPRLLLLDEPSMGLAPMMIDTVFASLAVAHHQGVTVLLVEQNAQLALTHTDRGYIMESGRIVLHDQSALLRDNPQVKTAYLGACLT